jgi:hypothetical protein
MEHPSGEALLDPFTVEVIREAVVAITDEMKTTLIRTAYSEVIYEGEDFTVGPLRCPWQYHLLRSRPSDVDVRLGCRDKDEDRALGRR